MKKIITKEDFINSLKKHYSLAACEALFEYLQEFCSGWTEYKDFQHVKERYPKVNSLEELRFLTIVLELKNGNLLVEDF